MWCEMKIVRKVYGGVQVYGIRNKYRVVKLIQILSKKRSDGQDMFNKCRTT